MNDDLPLSNMLLNHANGEDIIKEIKKVTRGALTIFFITPKVLWCGLAYTAYEGNDGENPYGPHLDSTIANYRMGYNVVKDNGMKMRFIEGEPVQINLNNVNSAGLKISTASEAKYAKNKQTATVNNIQDVSSLTVMGNEIQFQKNYAGYEGVINGFLQPYASPGYSANIVDDRYPERDGLYIIESTEVSFGVTGARRRVEIGPKIGFKA